MISGWREKWGQGSFPFLIVQLANYQFEPQVFPELREAQDMALELPNTAIAVTIDIGDPGNIHPGNKQEVGHRLCLAARAKAYGEDLLYNGPAFRSMYIAGDSCFISLSSIGEGLTVNGKKKLTGFTIAGDDRVFYDAHAAIDGNRIILWNSAVHMPVAVRYAWSNNPAGVSLYNKIGNKPYLPAHPFRTDDWPGLTYSRK
jgi:sialate O-acetylesterase